MDWRWPRRRTLILTISVIFVSVSLLVLVTRPVAHDDARSDSRGEVVALSGTLTVSTGKAALQHIPVNGLADLSRGIADFEIGPDDRGTYMHYLDTGAESWFGLLQPGSGGYQYWCESDSPLLPRIPQTDVLAGLKPLEEWLHSVENSVRGVRHYTLDPSEVPSELVEQYALAGTGQDPIWDIWVDSSDSLVRIGANATRSAGEDDILVVDLTRVERDISVQRPSLVGMSPGDAGVAPADRCWKPVSPE